jgi:hypothetical protein
MGRHEMDGSVLIGAPLGLGILLALGILMVAMAQIELFVRWFRIKHSNLIAVTSLTQPVAWFSLTNYPHAWRRGFGLRPHLGWPIGRSRAPRTSATSNVAAEARLLLSPQSADRRVMYPKSPRDIGQRFPRLSSRNRFASLISVQLEGTSEVDAPGLRANAPFPSPYTN